MDINLNNSSDSNGSDETTRALPLRNHEVLVEDNIQPAEGNKENNKLINNNLKKAGPAATSKQRSVSLNEPFRAYAFAETYKQRREYRQKKLEDEERLQRKVTAKPMPNFKKIHAKSLTKEPIETCVLSPQTPEVLKRGIAMKEHLKKKQDEYNAKLAERQPIVARPTSVLTEIPFKPKLETCITKVEPFDLKMTKRLKERKEFDEKYLKEVNLRKEKEEKEKMENETRMRKALREQTVFKAKPNPFK